MNLQKRHRFRLARTMQPSISRSVLKREMIVVLLVLICWNLFLLRETTIDATKGIKNVNHGFLPAITPAKIVQNFD